MHALTQVHTRSSTHWKNKTKIGFWALWSFSPVYLDATRQASIFHTVPTIDGHNLKFPIWSCAVSQFLPVPLPPCLNLLRLRTSMIYVHEPIRLWPDRWCDQTILLKRMKPTKRMKGSASYSWPTWASWAATDAVAVTSTFSVTAIRCYLMLA